MHRSHSLPTKFHINGLSLSLLWSFRAGPAVYDDAPPPAARQSAACLRCHGDEPDEPPEHHRQHGRSCSDAQPPVQSRSVRHQGNTRSH